jgi:intein-encoded DNA endonuclease-like protein
MMNTYCTHFVHRFREKVGNVVLNQKLDSLIIIMKFLICNLEYLVSILEPLINILGSLIMNQSLYLTFYNF